MVQLRNRYEKKGFLFSLPLFCLRLCTPALALEGKNGNISTTDHRKHQILQGYFFSPQGVTEDCLSCHSEAAAQIHKTIHWTWKHTDSSGRVYGKVGLSFNNFCVSLNSNEPRCRSCHIGYGWKDASFDHSRQEKVDCLMCHDTAGTYKRFPTASRNKPIAKQKINNFI